MDSFFLTAIFVNDRNNHPITRGVFWEVFLHPQPRFSIELTSSLCVRQELSAQTTTTTPDYL